MSTPSGLDLNLAGNVAAQEDEGHTISLDNEEGEPYNPPATMRVAGSFSRIHRRAKAAQSKRLIKSSSTRLTVGMVERQQVELAAACVLEWDGITADDKPVPFTHENVISLLDTAPWVLEQVQGAMNDHEGFTKSSSAT